MDYAVARRKMIENQIRTNRVTDPLVIAAMSDLPREAFVPAELKGIAYVDEDIPLGNGRYLMEPRVTALLLQAAQIQSNDVACDVGCGTGYASAVMGQMASTVVALESDPELARCASGTLTELGLNTVTLVEGPLKEGWPQQAPYDVILFGGAVCDVPSTILDQLADGGRLVAVIAGRHGLGKGTLFLQAGHVVSRRELFDASTPLLPDFGRQPTFSF